MTGIVLLNISVGIEHYFYNRWYVLGLEDYTWNCYTDEEFKEEFELVEGR